MIDLDGLPWFLVEPDPAWYLTRPWLALDFETTNIEKGSPLQPLNRIVCAAWCSLGDTTISYHRGDELDQADLLAAIADIQAREGFLIAHNAKFELQWLARAGLDLHNVLVYDTMIGDFVRAGNRRWKLDLGSVNARYGGTGKEAMADALISGGVCPSHIGDDLLKARVIKDVSDTLYVFYRQRKALRVEGKLAVMLTRCLLTPVLADMETKGSGLDRDRVYEEYNKALSEHTTVTRHLNEFTGKLVAKLAPDHPLVKLAGGGPIKPSSPVQMAYFLYDVLKFKELTRHGGKPIRGPKSVRFPEGMPKTDENTLLKLSARTARQRQFIDLKRRAATLNAALTKSLTFYKGVVDEHDGVWYASYNQCIAATHRLTSSGRKLTFSTVLDAKGEPKVMGIQGQNQPRRFKDLTRSKRPGWKMGNADGSQLEFRVAAFLGNDAQAKWNIRHDVDQHSLTASVLLADKWKDASAAERKILRDAGKPETFKPLYGGKYGTKEQMTYYQWFREQFPSLAHTQKGWTLTVLKKHELRMSWGITFYWPHTRMSPDGYIDNTPSIYNYPVQSLATADIIPIAVTYLWHRIARNAPDIELTATIHDSVGAELPPGTEEAWAHLARRCFTLDVYSYLRTVYKLDFDVPLGVGVSIGDRWAAQDSYEEEWNVEVTGESWRKGERKVVDTSP